jgi:hypothetical protein
MFFAVASVVVLSLIPLYLPKKRLDGIVTIGMFYFILLFVWFVLNRCFSAPEILQLRYKSDIVDSNFLTLSNMKSIASQVGYFFILLSSSYLYILFSCNNSSIFHNLVLSVLNLNHYCQRVVGEELERQSMYIYYSYCPL